MTSPIDQGPDTSVFDLKTLLAIASRQLHESVRIAKVADACAEVGRTEDAVQLVLGIEPLLYDARNLINTASILNRMRKD